MSVYITDYIKDPDIERAILGNAIVGEPSSQVKVLLVWHQLINSDYLDLFPNLSGIVRYGVGFDAIDLVEVKNRGLVFCNTPDYGTDEVSDTVIAMMLNITRGVSRYDYLCRQYNDGSWQENTLGGLRRTSVLTLAVIGAGRIGGSVLRKAKAIGFNVIFYDPYRDRGYEKMLGTGRVETIDELLDIADIISINAPLTDETYGMVDESFVSRMKKGAALINTARGEIIKNLDIFVEPLKARKISGLALDVLPTEPPEKTGLIKAWENREYWLEGRVIINPHTSYFTQDSYEEMRRKAAENVKRILNDELPYNIIVDK